MRKLSNLPMTVYDGYGNDVTQEYYVKFVGEPLRVDRRAIEVASVSRTKEYDGQALEGRFRLDFQGKPRERAQNRI